MRTQRPAAHTFAAAAAVFSAFALAGCTGSHTAPTVTPPSSSPVGGENGERTVPSPHTAPATTDLKLGSVVHLPSSEGLPTETVAALAYKQLPNDGYPVDAVQVRLCVGADGDPAGYPVSDQRWALLLDHGESTHTDVTSGAIEPGFPTLGSERTVKPGKCVKGWINFTRPPSRAESVQYDTGELQVSWKL